MDHHDLRILDGQVDVVLLEESHLSEVPREDAFLDGDGVDLQRNFVLNLSEL